jgi:hypothetical protein
LFFELCYLFSKLPLGYICLAFDTLSLDFSSFNVAFKLNDSFIKVFDLLKPLLAYFFFHVYDILKVPDLFKFFAEFDLSFMSNLISQVQLGSGVIEICSCSFVELESLGILNFERSMFYFKSFIDVFEFFKVLS